jgi:hypothetical protein
MILARGAMYESEKSDIRVEVLNIYYENAEKIKCKLRISHKKYGYIYDMAKAYTLKKSMINHWERRYLYDFK